MCTNDRNIGKPKLSTRDKRDIGGMHISEIYPLENLGTKLANFFLVEKKTREKIPNDGI